MPTLLYLEKLYSSMQLCFIFLSTKEAKPISAKEVEIHKSIGATGTIPTSNGSILKTPFKKKPTSNAPNKRYEEGWFATTTVLSNCNRKHLKRQA